MWAIEQWAAAVGLSAIGARFVNKYGVRPLRRTVRNIEQISALLGENGGQSLGDMIRGTHRNSTDLRVRVDWLCDQMDRPVFECSADGANVRINDKFTERFGYGPNEMLGDRWKRILHPEDRSRVLEAWSEALREQRLYEDGYRILTRSGMVLRVRVTVEPGFTDRGALHRWMGRFESIAAIEDPAAAAAGPAPAPAGPDLLRTVGHGGARL